MSPTSSPTMEVAKDTKEVQPVEDAPRGQPVSYGPIVPRSDRALAINPFWSERTQEDALLRSLRPQELPSLDAAVPGMSSGSEEMTGGQMDVRQLLTMVLQQNNMLKQEVDQLRGQVKATHEPRAVDEVVKGSEKVQFGRALELTNQPQEPQVLSLEDRKSEATEPAQGNEWTTPPESVSAKKPVETVVEAWNSNGPPVQVTTVSGSTGMDATKDQTQVLGQVTQTLSNLVAQLAAVSGPTGGVQERRDDVCQVRGHGPSQSGEPGHQSGAQSEQRQQGRDPPFGFGAGGHPFGGGAGYGPPGGHPGYPGHGQGHGGFGSVPNGCGGSGDGSGYPGMGPRMTPFQFPQEMMWLQGVNETIRSVELPALPGIREGELGGSVVGDWLTLVAPIMKDLSVSSSSWWETVMKTAGEAYQQWLLSDPVQRLHVNPTMPPECMTHWARLEQRGQSMLLGALPEGLKGEVLATRSTNTVEILYRIYTRYQPGGLGEKALLLRQLVDGKSPGTAGEVLEQIRGWKRNLRRAQELNVATPDPTLLIGALDKMSGSIIRSSTQLAFRLNSTRAQLMVDINPTLSSVTTYADAIMAEAEGLLHAGTQVNTTVKVKAMDGGAPEPPQKKGDGKGKAPERTGKGPACKFFGTEDGCKKGQDCSYVHDWSTVDRSQPRCWTCSSTKDQKRDCTVKAITGPGGSSGAGPNGGSTDSGGKGKKGGEKGKQSDPTPTLKKSEKTENGEAVKTEEADAKAASTSAAAPAQELLREATSLLKSLKLPAVRSMRISSLEVQAKGRALLDGGATHALRVAKDLKEFESATEVQVELAQGSVTLRQLPWSKTLLSATKVQSIVPLGVLAEIGYCVHWEGTKFELTDPNGCVLDTLLESGCPTVDEDLGLELIKEVERHFIQRRARLAVLRSDGNPGDLDGSTVKELKELRTMFPEVPEEILERILPKRQWNAEELPWNRRTRRRIRRAAQVVIHLFSGKTDQFWKKELGREDREVLCVDVEIDRRQNLLRDDVYDYLLEVADGGTLEAVLGGPPCRTVSRLRYRQPGPPPLRSRLGPERFGLQGLDEVLLKKVHDDTILWLRQYYLYHRAKQARYPRKTIYVQEQPEDPEKYLSIDEISKRRFPSLWATPEWQRIKEENRFEEVSFDQGPMGHSRRKPTTLGGNLCGLRELAEVRGPGSSREGHQEPMTIEEKMQLSRTWASWASGLKMALVTALKRELDGHLRKLTLEEWKQHLLNDHQPYYRGCRTCLEACGQSRHHRRVVTPDSYTLSVDLAGPFKKGEDQLGQGRYMLLGTFTVPISKEGRALHLKEEEAATDGVGCGRPGGEASRSAPVQEDGRSGEGCGRPGGEASRSDPAQEESTGGEGCGRPGGEASRSDPARVEGGIFDDCEDPPDQDPVEDPQESAEAGAGEKDPLAEEEDHTAYSPKDEKNDDAEKWKERIEAEENFAVRHITLVEILPDRSGPAVISGLSRMHARLRYLGLPLLRLHSDRAGELRSKPIRKWTEDRKIYRTYTDGDSFKSNGRAESEIGMIKKQIRTLLKETKFEANLWPLAARHAAERRMRKQLEGLGCPTRALLQFGREAYATQKIWNEKYQDWKMSRRKVTIMGPDVAMSASMPGYYVKGEDGKYFHSSDVVVAEGPPPEAQWEAVELGSLHEHGVRRRITGKTPMLSSLQAFSTTKDEQIPIREAEIRRLRGLQLLMEELDLQDLALTDYTEGSAETDQDGSDRFIQALLADVEELAERLDDHEKVWQEVTTDEIEKETEAQQVFLQTRMYSLAEVRAELESWKDSMRSEFKSLTEETGAVRVISAAEAEELRRGAEEKGILFERIPGKAIFSRKAGSGKRKCRACACGNYMSQRALTDTYAGGTGATEVRCLLKKGALERWSAVTLDVKTAFLRAPRDHSREVVVVQPPQIFVMAGVVNAGDLWLVDRALYGLTTSPKEWTQFRNEKVSKFTYEKEGIQYAVESTGDQDIWRIVRSQRCVDGCGNPEDLGDRSASTPEVTPAVEVAGYFVTYVDDVLAVGEEAALQGFCDRVAQEWEIGEPEWVTSNGPPVRFLGMELERKGATYRLHQESFIQSLLEKYPGERGSGLSHVKIPDEELEVNPAAVREAQKQTGELLWIAGRTRPDVALAVSVMSQYATKRPKGVADIGREVRAYLRTCPGLALEYQPLQAGDFGVEGTQSRPRHANLVEVYTDASFASANLRSTSGVVGFFAGSPVFWHTGRQSFVTLSTAEAELMAMLEGLTAMRCIKSIVDMLQQTPTEGRMFSDSTAGISIALGTTGSWRTRHLRIRAQGLHEAIERGETTLEHQPGKSLVADGMTKQLLGTPLKRFIQALGMMIERPEVIQMNALRVDGGEGPHMRRLQDSVGLLIIASTLMMTPVEAAETLSSEEDDGWSLGTVLTILVVAVLIIGDLITRFGLPKLRSWFCPREELKVKLLNDAASLPTRGTSGSAGLDLCSTQEYRVAPGEHQLIKTGLAVELPRGTYGRIASRSGLAAHGIEVSAGVIDRDFRGEVKVLIRNLSGREFWVRQGDRIAQLIVEKVMEVEVSQVESLSETSRGRLGFGSTGIEGPVEDALLPPSSIRSLRLGSNYITEEGLNINPRSMRVPAEDLLRQRPQTPPVPEVVSSTTNERTQRGGSSTTRDQSGGSSATRGSPLENRRVEGCGNPHDEGDRSASLPGDPSNPTSMSSSMTEPSSTFLSSETPQRMTTWPSSCIAKSPSGKHSLAESLKRRRSSKPIPPTATGFLALCGETGHGPRDAFPDFYLAERQWFCPAVRTMENFIYETGIAGGYWPLERSDELWNLVIQRPAGRAPDVTKEFKLTKEVTAVVRIHSTPRQKIYDFEDENPEERKAYCMMQLTLAYLLLNQKAVVCSQRRGRKGPYLDETWTGYTIHLRVA
eukprot:s1247_g27.t1